MPPVMYICLPAIARKASSATSNSPSSPVASATSATPEYMYTSLTACPSGERCSRMGLPAW